MNDATLDTFRTLADAMAGDTPRDWEWVGPHMSQRMFGITQARAEGYAASHGGTARRMEPVAPAPRVPWVEVDQETVNGHTTRLPFSIRVF